MARIRKADNGGMQEKQISGSAALGSPVTMCVEPSPGESESIWVWELED